MEITTTEILGGGRLGFYYLKEDRIAYWLSVGARPSETVARLLRKYTGLSFPGKSGAKSHLEPPAEEAAGPAQVMDESASAEAGTPESTQDSPNEEEETQ